MSAKEIKRAFLQSLGNLVVPNLANALAKSLKFNFLNYEILDALKEKNQNYIAVFWHGKMFAGWYVFGREKSSALVSRSKDGEILSRALKKWGYKVIRGSSHIGGKEAIELMKKSLEDGYSLSITPDGPTGPREQMKAGAAVLAKKTGKPIILTGICYKKKRVFNSWDKFELPRFFSEVTVKFSEPVYVPSDLDYDQTDALIKELGKRLSELNKSAEGNC